MRMSDLLGAFFGWMTRLEIRREEGGPKGEYGAAR